MAREAKPLKVEMDGSFDPDGWDRVDIRGDQNITQFAVGFAKEIVGQLIEESSILLAGKRLQLNLGGTSYFIFVEYDFYRVCVSELTHVVEDYGDDGLAAYIATVRNQLNQVSAAFDEAESLIGNRERETAMNKAIKKWESGEN